MDKKTLTAIERWNLIIGIAMIVASVAFWRADVVIGMATGVALGTANFLAIRWVVSKFMTAKESAKAGLMVALIFKMAAMMVAVFLVMKFLPMNMFAFLIGISVFFISILVETARMSGRTRHNGNGGTA